MKKLGFNPYLPSWEYIPDGEPYVFGDRVYVYGSHDFFNGWVFCMGDYVCWSAPVDNLADWRYEGVIYPRNEDPMNKDGSMCLYAPDVTVGPDGRYYLYYVLDHLDIVSVAVCDTPAGKYEFYGNVHYADGTLYGRKEGDEPQFDPGVLTEGDTTYLYTGFCARGDKSRHGAMLVELGPDMLTIQGDMRIVAPGVEYQEGTGYEGHAFFEAPSIRKHGDTYYFVYSSTPMHELCYATSKDPRQGFTYGGVIVSNVDLHIGDEPDKPKAYGGNNHGSIIEINGQWYIFYHRQTNRSWYSRQGCLEPIQILPDGSIPQVEMTSCGPNGGPLPGKGEYPAYIACHLFDKERALITGAPNSAYVTQDGKDGDEIQGHIANIHDGTVIGFKYFDFDDVQKVTLMVRGYGWGGTLHVKTSKFGPALASMKLENTNVWTAYSAPITLPKGKSSLYITYEGGGAVMLYSVIFE
ncbi:MAG: family 43 glycosylhydrolase [Clostridia bacterium]|nr:family 43 glycosylhydrolase [Clostridia bacterium]